MAEEPEEGGRSGGAGESQTSYGEILDKEIEGGLRELRRPAGSLFLSSLSAGLDVGFSVLAIGAVLTMSRGVLPEIATQILVANAYAVGFVFVIVGRSELFTEHTTRAVLPLLAGCSTVGRVARLWALVYAANLLGAAAFAWLLALVGPALGAVDRPALVEIARELLDHPPWVIFASAVLAGWLMGLLSWLVKAGQETISQIAVVWLVTATIGFAGLHHSIVGSVEVLAGAFAGPEVAVGEWLVFLLWATLGNAVGGAVFVALLKYAHAKRADRS